MVAVNSSAIEDVTHDSKTWTMVVTFKSSGRKYTFWDVPESEYRKFIEADSVGRYFNTHIRGQYQGAGSEL